MRYDRKVKYLDYCENGERIRGGGFLKTEIFEDSFKMELTVRGVRGIGEFTGDVILCGNGREEALGKIQLENGQGEFRHACHINFEGGTIGGTGIGCDELTGIRIPLGEGREITCIWGVSNPAAESAGEQEEVGPAGGQAVRQLSKLSAKRQEKAGKKETGSHILHSEETAPDPAEKEQEVRKAEITHPKEKVQDVRKGEEKHPKEKAQEVREGEEKHPREKAQEVVKTEMAVPREQSLHPDPKEQQAEAVPLLENKWLQLCAIYPHINPFRDQREYLSIGPEDFVLFSSESYKAASNSFMLHGYYNYHHLILAREERRGEILYYVGVPGNYFDREKQVAIMFGFESFECAQEPAQSSDFGYYMMKVQL